MDPNNVVVLCAQGMQAEAAGRADEARARFEQAWEVATDDDEQVRLGQAIAAVASTAD